jgi:putative SOS response-associated peptidase YedK
MCGRYIQVSSPTLLVEHFDVDEVAIPETPEADYNIAPRKEVLTIVQRGLDVPETAERRPERARSAEAGATIKAATGGTRVLEQMRWGLVPSWADDVKIGDRLINARAESLAEKSAFKTAFRKRRCIIPADGFYEWQRQTGTKKKQPMFIHRRDGEPIAFAGLWEVWKDRDEPDAGWLLSCAIVTTRANATMAPIHDRMPVILTEDTWDEWLDVRINDRATIDPLLDPVPDELIETWPVSTMVNSANNNGAELVDRVEPEPPATLFS